MELAMALDDIVYGLALMYIGLGLVATVFGMIQVYKNTD